MTIITRISKSDLGYCFQDQVYQSFVDARRDMTAVAKSLRRRPLVEAGCGHTVPERDYDPQSDLCLNCAAKFEPREEY